MRAFAVHGLFLLKFHGCGFAPFLYFGGKMTAVFFLNSVLLGVGLAMDAFSVACANGLNEPKMGMRKMLGISSVFGFFQTAMPLLGWILVYTVVDIFSVFERVLPWIALALLGYIGGKMVWDGIRFNENDEKCAVGFVALMVQAVATSVDALSVGFTIATLPAAEAVIECVIIGVVTTAISLLGLILGKKFGTLLSGKASILGGVILIVISIEIFIKGVI